MPFEIIASEVLKESGVAILIFLLFLILRKIFVKIVFRYVLSFSQRTKTELDNNILLAFEKPLQTLFIVVGFYFSTKYLPLTPYQSLLTIALLRSSIIILLAWGFSNFVSISSILFSEIGKKLDLELDRILIPFASKLLKLIIILLSISIIAQEWDYDIGGIIAGLGLGGLAFALAAKDTVSNIFAGIVIVLDKPFSIGDWIYSESVEGTVEDITFRSTKIRTFAQALVTLPNSVLTNQSVTNWSRMGKRRVTFNLGITYNTPAQKLKKCITEIKSLLEKHPDIHKETIFVRFDSFAESSLDIFIYFFTNTTIWGEYLRVKEEMNFAIMEILEKEAVSVAFPSRSIYFENQLEKIPNEQNETASTL